nr:protein no-on-transient A-like [Aegilops tauschii subsp. strangulata]
MAALVKYANSDSTKDPKSDEDKIGKGKKNGNAKGHQHNPANQGGNKRKADGSLEFVANSNAQGNNQRRKGRPPPRSGGSGPTLEELLNEPCPRHGTREKPATHLWKDCTIMKAFKNSNMFDGNHGPGGGSGGGGFHGPGGGSNSNFQGSQGNQGGYHQQSGQGGQQQQQSGYQSNSIMCSSPVCANETRNFIRGL